MLEATKSNVSLATSGMLVTVEVSVYSGTKQNQSVSDEVTTAKRADKSAGKFTQHLFADNPDHKRVVNYRQTIYNWLQRITYEWNKAQRILPSVSLEKFMTEYNQHETEFNNLVDTFCNNYNSIISDMAFKQGDMFDRSLYPTVEQVRDKFKIRLYTAEVPAQDWRCRVADDIAEDLRQQYEKQTQEIVQGVLNDQISRLSELLSSISHCCGVDEKVSESGEVKAKKRKIYDTTIENAKAFAAQVRGFNVAGSNNLLSAAEQLEAALDGVSAEDLRESDAVRAKVKDDIDSILSKFEW